MITTLLACRDNTLFSNLIDTFQNQGIQIDSVSSGSLALTMMTDRSYNLLITDEHLPDMTGIDLIKKTITLNPLINCVAVSTLSHKDFHEKTEGMGVLMQFPPKPDVKTVQALLDHLDKIYALSKK
ncbi:MAG: response regulator [Pseudomonadota bacterium]